MKKIIVMTLVLWGLSAASAVAQEQIAERYSIDGKLLKAVFSYLSTQPYKDVYQLIENMQEDAKPIDIEQPQEDPKTRKEPPSNSSDYTD